MEPNETNSNYKKYIFISIISLCIILIIVALVKTNVEKSNPIDQTAIIIQYSNDPSAKIPHTPIRTVYSKMYGMTRIICCLIQDTNWVLIKKECNELLNNEKFGFIYCYDDSTKVFDITKFSNALDAFPEEGKDYVLEFKKLPDEGVSFTKFINNSKK